MDGKFTASSGRMEGSYKERTYEYEIVQVERQDGQTVKGTDIDLDDLRDADRIFFTIEGGHIEDDEGKLYRWIAGPYPDSSGMESAIEDMMLYGSP